MEINQLRNLLLRFALSQLKCKRVHSGSELLINEAVINAFHLQETSISNRLWQKTFPRNNKQQDQALTTALQLNSIIQPTMKLWLLIGEVGTGKTTACKALAANPQLWEGNISAVINLPLRNLIKSNIEFSNLGKIVKELCLLGEDKLACSSDEIVQCLIANKDKIVFILDGLDEVLSLVRLNEHPLSRFLHDLLSTFPKVLISSRPFTEGKELIINNTFFLIERCLRLTALTPDTLKTQILSFPFKEQNSAASLLAWLEHYPSLKEMANTLLYSSLLCEFYEQEKSHLKQGSSITLVEIINKVISYHVRRSREKKRDFINFAALQNALATLAFEATREKILIFTEEWMENKLKLCTEKYHIDSRSLVNAVVDTGLLLWLEVDQQQADKYSFIHRAYQEFFTASYLVELFQKDDFPNAWSLYEWLNLHKYDASYKNTWIHLVGLLYSEAKTSTDKTRWLPLWRFLNWLDNGPLDQVGIYHLLLKIRCLDECCFDEEIVSPTEINLLLNKMTDYLDFLGSGILGLVFHELKKCVNFRKYLIEYFNTWFLELIEESKEIKYHYGIYDLIGNFLAAKLIAPDVVRNNLDYLLTYLPSAYEFYLNSYIVLIRTLRDEGFLNSMPPHFILEQREQIIRGEIKAIYILIGLLSNNLVPPAMLQELFNFLLKFKDHHPEVKMRNAIVKSLAVLFENAVLDQTSRDLYIQTLLNNLQDNEPSIRKRTIAIFEQNKDTRLILKGDFLPRLIQMVNDQNAEVRQYAINTIRISLQKEELEKVEVSKLLSNLDAFLEERDVEVAVESIRMVDAIITSQLMPENNKYLAAFLLKRIIRIESADLITPDIMTISDILSNLVHANLLDGNQINDFIEEITQIASLLSTSYGDLAILLSIQFIYSHVEQKNKMDILFNYLIKHLCHQQTSSRAFIILAKAGELGLFYLPQNSRQYALQYTNIRLQQVKDLADFDCAEFFIFYQLLKEDYTPEEITLIKNFDNNSIRLLVKFLLRESYLGENIIFDLIKISICTDNPA